MTIQKLPGSQIASNTITITQIQTTAVTSIVTQIRPKVSSLIYPGNDTAGNTVGGQTVYINGSGFQTNNAIYINGNAVPSKTFISASNLSFTTPVLSTGIYPVYVINTDSGSTAIFIPGYVSSAEPAWATSAGSLSVEQNELTAWSYSLSATGDAPITYTLASGSSLPSGISLAANGVVSGTLSSPPGIDTTYTFSVVAADAENQDSTRQFTVTTTAGEGVLFANNVLLIHADGTNNKNNHTFSDSSNNNFTITRAGNATQGSFSPFSQTGWSGYFDGTDDYLTWSGSTLSGNFTVECWVYKTAVDGSGYTIVFGSGTGNQQFTFDNITAGSIGLVIGASSIIYPIGTAVTLNIWHHLAWVREGSTCRAYVNGIQQGTGTSSASFVLDRIGRYHDQYGSNDMNGYISNIRIVAGTCLYPSGTTFTPSTTPLTNIANTSLLTLQSNRFIDNSNNNFTITRNGDVSIQAFSPFAPTAAYSTANVGGSGYFDGTGDYLALTNNAAFGFGSGDFTMECWFYKTTTNLDVLFDTRVGATGATGMALYVQSNTLKAGNDGERLAGGTIVSNSWNHCAVVRSGNNLYLYLNGTRTATAAFSTTLAVSSSPYIGNSGSNEYTGGYLASVRILKGTAQYTGSTYTIPTAPLTNIANTSLLCNFTNAGIFDQTAKNVLETVGDAKVSTAQYKYGTGSMYFDGTGDWLILPRSQLFNFGTGNLTIEGWINVPNINSTYRTIFSIGSPVQIYSVSGTVEAYFNDSDDSLTYIVNPASGPSSSVAANTWCHFAIVRNGTTFTTYVNGIGGTAVTGVTAAIAYSATAPYIGTIGSNTSQYPFTGYIDDLRITKGYARYTSTFTPPTSALKDK